MPAPARLSVNQGSSAPKPPPTVNQEPVAIRQLLVSVVGYYCMVALVLNAFEVPLEKGVPDPFSG